MIVQLSSSYTQESKKSEIMQGKLEEQIDQLMQKLEEIV